MEVAEKFQKFDDGFYYNIKLKNETERRKNYSESRRNNRMKNISKSYVKHMETGTGTGTGTENIETITRTGNKNEIETKAEREEYLADIITGSLDKESKEVMNKFNNLFSDEI